MKKICILLLLALCSLATVAQINLTPYVISDVQGTSERTNSVLENKLRTLLAANNVLSKFGDSRFILAAKFDVLDKEIVSSAPMQVVYNIQAHFAIGDGESGICYGAETFELKGVGQTEERAILYGLQKLNYNSPALQRLIASSKGKIVSYYNTNGKNILMRAKSLASAGSYDEAIYELSLVPQECVHFAAANSMLNSLYKQSINSNAQKALSQAKALWAADPTAENAIAVMELLSEISPSASCYGQVQAFIKEIKDRNIKVADREWMQQVNMEKMRIKAIENIAVAYAKSRPKVVYKIYGWW